MQKNPADESILSRLRSLAEATMSVLSVSDATEDQQASPDGASEAMLRAFLEHAIPILRV